MIAIKNMAMPKDCFSCPFAGGAFGICRNENFRVRGKPAPECPLLEVHKLGALVMVDPYFGENGIQEAKHRIAVMMADKLYASGGIKYQVEDRMFVADPSMSAGCIDEYHYKVWGTLNVVLPAGVKAIDD